ncbi:MAG: 4Fe-4S binding protein [Anaerolineales bacterium]|nr:4Fe-4S binding protein [Anaerolineales bacterium]
MEIKVNQELCAGCGVCTDVCPNGAVYLVDQRAVIDESRCTECEACIEACPNGAITAIAEPARSTPVVLLPAAETQMVPVSTHSVLPEKVAPARGLVPLAGAALAFLGSEVAPRLVDVLFNALERRLAQPKAAAVTSSTTVSRILTTQSRGRQKQSRYRGGRAGNRYHKGRR